MGADPGDTLPTILIVDDQPANLLALEAILSDLPVRLVRANSGTDALRHLLREELALVLLDVQMPGMDGFQTAAAVKAHPRTASVPIIFITAIDRDAAHIFKGYERGAVDYVLKPFDPAILRAKVSIFVDLFRKSETIKAQAKLLREQEIEALERRSEQRYRRLADSVPLAVWATHLDGTVYYANRAWVDYSKVSLEKMSSLFCAGSTHADDLDAASVAWRTAREAGAPFEVQVRLRRASDGSFRWHLVRGVGQRDEHGDPEGYIVTATDIDDQKHAENIRERAYEQEAEARRLAEAASRMKDEFLANVSHELRTPLHAILGWTRMLRSGVLEPPRMERALETIERNANVQTALVEDLLDVSRVMSGKLRLDIQEVDVVAATRAAIDTVRPTADGKAIELSFATEVPEKCIAADPERLQQIVCNLVTNAVKFTPNGGRVDVRVTVADDLVAIAVSDSGVGISEDLLPHVFDRFRQADSTTTRKHQGLGLGLAIVRHLVELHGGQAFAESRGVDRGSRFTVNLPIRAVQIAPAPRSEPIEVLAPPSSSSVKRKLEGVRILFVDDQPDARELFSELFERAGATVFAAEAVAEALDLLAAEPVHVIVSDIGLPGEDGYSFLRKVRANERNGAFTPAIAMSGFSAMEDHKRSLAAGFQVHITKPVDPVEVIALVATLADRRHDASAAPSDAEAMASARGRSV